MIATFKFILKIYCTFLFLINCETNKADEYRVEDIHIPAECEKVASVGDHLLIEYSIYSSSSGSQLANLEMPSQLLHINLTPEDLPVLSGLKGMCKDATRRIHWTTSKLDIQPILIPEDSGIFESAEDGLHMDLHVVHITTGEEYKIFGAFRNGNISAVLDLIENHKGVNALDEWGQTPLMVAVQMNQVDVVAALLNTRMPRVDINAAKPSGYTALFYAIEKSSPSILSALLRRGADPNSKLLTEGSRGTTPLHFACMLEKVKQAEMLLEYGAVPDARNEHGLVPLQLLPGDAVRSTKLFFKKMFENAIVKARDAENGIRAEAFTQRNDL